MLPTVELSRPPSILIEDLPVSLGHADHWHPAIAAAGSVGVAPLANVCLAAVVPAARTVKYDAKCPIHQICHFYGLNAGLPKGKPDSHAQRLRAPCRVIDT